jgi:hypothetical protein
MDVIAIIRSKQRGDADKMRVEATHAPLLKRKCGAKDFMDAIICIVAVKTIANIRAPTHSRSGGLRREP